MKARIVTKGWIDDDPTISPRSSHNPLALERFRGRVPDRVLTALYDRMRNRIVPADVALRVRQLAGVVDEHGKPLPGTARERLHKR